MKNILKKLAKIQNELKCRKDKKAQNYKYRSAEDVFENLKPILEETNCTVICSDDVEVINDETYYKSTVTLYDVDTEETIENHSYVKEWEAKFMSVGQYSWATISYCRKYALCWLFAIDDWEDLDKVEWEKKEEKKPDFSEEDLEKITISTLEKNSTVEEFIEKCKAFKNISKEMEEKIKHKFSEVANSLFEDAK